MEELKRLITEYGKFCCKWGINYLPADNEERKYYQEDAEQAKQNLLNYIEQNYERR